MPAAAAKGRSNARRKQGLRGGAVVEAFASTIVSHQLSDPEVLNSRLLEVIAAWRKDDDGGIESSNVMGWHSPRSLFARKDEAILEFAGHVRLAVVSYVWRYIPDFDPANRASLTEAWVNINGSGGFNVPHIHGEFQVSGCYYMSVPSASSEPRGAI
jgi:uncharacterized protein (TIGR02466 family)